MGGGEATGRNNMLGSNIILFTADRGQGKTSAMKSFANFLDSADKDRGVLKAVGNARFKVLDSIDPSALHMGEDIIRVVISRLFCCLNEMMERDNGTKRMNATSEERARLDELLKMFQECYDNINYMEKGGHFDEYSDDLENLAKLGDSSRLRENLQQLVRCFLKYCIPEDITGYLVIPIDDVDMAMGDLFQICEKIYNYLSLPNVIVLMAFDYKQMGYIIYQKYLERYGILLNSKEDKIMVSDECYMLAMKYMEKLFPDNHHINLPLIDELITVQQEEIIVQYAESGAEPEKVQSGKLKNLMEERLYRCTGIVLLDKPGELPRILPRTMRELTNFLKMLFDMREVDFGLVCNDIYRRHGRSEQKQQDRKDQLDTLRKNLKMIKQYFLEYWCTKYLDARQLKVIHDMDVLNHARDKNVKKLLSRLNSYLDAKLRRTEADNFQELRYFIETNGSLQKEHEFQEGLLFYFTVFLNEWFSVAVESPGQLSAFLDFTGNITRYPDSYKKLQYNGYYIAELNVDIEKFKSYLPVEERERPTAPLKVWLSCFGRTENGEECIEMSEDQEEAGHNNLMWNPDVENIHFDILKPFMSILQNESWVDFQHGLAGDRLDEKKKDIGDSLVDTDNISTGPEKSNEYIVEIKNILTNCEVQREICQCMEDVGRKIRKRRSRYAWRQLCGEIYKTIGTWNRCAGYLGESVFEEMGVRYLGMEDAEDIYFRGVLLAEDNNTDRYSEECKAAYAEGKTRARDSLKKFKDLLEGEKAEEAGQQEAIVKNTMIKNLQEELTKAQTYQPRFLSLADWQVVPGADTKISIISEKVQEAKDIADAYNEIYTLAKAYCDGTGKDIKREDLLKQIEDFLKKYKE